MLSDFGRAVIRRRTISPDGVIIKSGVCRRNQAPDEKFKGGLSEVSASKLQISYSSVPCSLVKGLEFDHAVIVRDVDWQEKNWGTHRDLYVALTRGCKSVTLTETAY